MSEGKENNIAALLLGYGIHSTEDIQDVLKDILAGTIQKMLEAEMDEHLVYDPYERNDSTNARNGKRSKTIRSKYNETVIDVPQDRESIFEPKVVEIIKKTFLVLRTR